MEESVPPLWVIPRELIDPMVFVWRVGVSHNPVPCRHDITFGFGGIAPHTISCRVHKFLWYLANLIEPDHRPLIGQERLHIFVFIESEEINMKAEPRLSGIQIRSNLNQMIHRGCSMKRADFVFWISRQPRFHSCAPEFRHGVAYNTRFESADVILGRGLLHERPTHNLRAAPNCFPRPHRPDNNPDPAVVLHEVPDRGSLCEIKKSIHDDR